MWGGVNNGILERIEAVESEIPDIKSQMALKLPADRVTDSASITEPGWALDAREKNGALEGTLAGRIEEISNLSLKYHGTSFENYVMKYTDFPVPGIYQIGTLAENPAGNAPDSNVGDYRALAVNNNPYFQVLLLFSPRWLERFYYGRFWNGEFSGWRKVSMA